MLHSLIQTYNFLNRQIYHCPFCNLCRVGEGLGVGVFHCMTCNACMLSKSLSIHTCRENCLEDNCPICREDIFTSATPVKQLPCGHLMHSTCFQVLDSYKVPYLTKLTGSFRLYCWSFLPFSFSLNTHLRTTLLRITHAQSVARQLGTWRSENYLARKLIKLVYG